MPEPMLGARVPIPARFLNPSRADLIAAPVRELTIRIDGYLDVSPPAGYIEIGDGDARELMEIVSYEPLRVRRGDVIYELKTAGKEATHDDDPAETP